MKSNTNVNTITACTNECGGVEEEISSNKKVCTDQKQNCALLNDMITSDNKTCANCGKEGSDVTNTCNKCKSVMYCNAVCKKKHRHRHKKDCEENLRLAAERAAELHDEALFKQPLPFEDCPICFLRMPSLNLTGKRYMPCCGKMICSGCAYAPVYDDQGNVVAGRKCPFCRTPAPTSDEETLERYEKRVEAGDYIAIYNQGNYYKDGIMGFPQDHKKALELWHRAAELGNANAYACIGYAYSNGQGVDVDKKKAVYYYELAAIAGNTTARHNLGALEQHAGNMDRALKHFMISVRNGYTGSLDAMRKLYSRGHVTKDDYTKALQAYQASLGGIKSVQRDKAAAYSDHFRYY